MEDAGSREQQHDTDQDLIQAGLCSKGAPAQTKHVQDAQERDGCHGQGSGCEESTAALQEHRHDQDQGKGNDRYIVNGVCTERDQGDRDHQRRWDGCLRQNDPAAQCVDEGEHLHEPGSRQHADRDDKICRR